MSFSQLWGEGCWILCWSPLASCFVAASLTSTVWPRPDSVPCQASTASLFGQCSLAGLNREQPRAVFPAPLRPVFSAGPQLRSSAASVPSTATIRGQYFFYCRTSTATICAQFYEVLWGGLLPIHPQGALENTKAAKALTCRLFKRMALLLACVRRFSSWPLWLQRALPQNIPASEAVNPQMHLEPKKKPQKQQRTKIWNLKPKKLSNYRQSYSRQTNLRVEQTRSTDSGLQSPPVVLRYNHSLLQLRNVR